MDNEATIHRRKDGSINTSYYMEKGREARSAQAHTLATQSGHWLLSILKKRDLRPIVSQTTKQCH